MFFDKFTEIVAYAMYTEALADMKYKTILEIKKVKEAELFLMSDGKNRDIRSAQVDSNPEMLELITQLVEYQALSRMVRGLREGYEVKLNLISREITRRQGEFNNNMRKENIK